MSALTERRLAFKQIERLTTKNKIQQSHIELLREALVKSKDWFYVHSKNGKIYADGVKPACIAWIESALSQTETK